MGAKLIPPPCYQRPSGGLYLSIEQYNLVNNVWTLVELDTVCDLGNANDGIEDTGTHRITPGVAGLYLVICQVTFLNPVADKEYDALVMTDGTMHEIRMAQHSSNVNLLGVAVSGLIWLNKTQYIELYARSNSGTDLVDLSCGPPATFLHVQRVR